MRVRARDALDFALRWNAGAALSVLLIGVGYTVVFLILFQSAKGLESHFSVSLWYPPAGLRLAALFWFGWRFGFVAFAAELAVYTLSGYASVWLVPGESGFPAGRFAGMLAAAALPPLCYALAATAVARLPLAIAYRPSVAYVTQLCCAGALGALLAALTTCHVLAASGFIAANDLPRAVSAFWIGDFIGILAFTPLAGAACKRWLGSGSRLAGVPGAMSGAMSGAISGALAIAPPVPVRRGGAPAGRVVVEALFVCALAALLLRTADLHRTGTDWYPLLLPIIWCAFRWGLGGAIIAAVAVDITVVALVSVYAGNDIRSVQVFVIAASLTGLLLGAFSSALREERASLESRVQERTNALADEVERRREAEAAALAEKRRTERYIDMSRAVIIACDGGGRVTMVNAEGCTVLGRGRDRLAGAHFVNDFIAPEYRSAVTLDLDRLLSGAVPASTFAAPIVRDDQRRVFVEWRAASLRGEFGAKSGILLAGVDITERMRDDEQTRFLATRDPLTGVYNRYMGEEIIASALARARRHDSGMAVLFADLNNFKPINDIWGHAAGDRILVETAQRLTARVRQTDRIIRHGGDEFIVVIEDIAGARAAARLGAAIARTITRPIELERARVRVGVAIGIACFPQHGTTPAALIEAADAAMYARKRRRGSGIQLAG